MPDRDVLRLEGGYILGCLCHGQDLHAHILGTTVRIDLPAVPASGGSTEPKGAGVEKEGSHGKQPVGEQAPAKVHIWSGEHGAYWRPKAQGYTTLAIEAGVWGRKEAERLIGSCGPEKQIELRQAPEPSAPAPCPARGETWPEQWCRRFLAEVDREAGFLYGYQRHEPEDTYRRHLETFLKAYHPAPALCTVRDAAEQARIYLEELTDAQPQFLGAKALLKKLEAALSEPCAGRAGAPQKEDKSHV